jgi:hypothetical protein
LKRNIKKGTMKTRNFLTTLVFIFSAIMVSEASNTIEKNAITMYPTIAEKNVLIAKEAVSHSETDSYILDEWIAERNSWEQEGTESESNSEMAEVVSLEDWIHSRDNWETEGVESAAHPTLHATTVLEEWISDRDNWEQTGSEVSEQHAQNATTFLEEWIKSRDNWEQK